ncbi:UNVERIFIED_CONTAM: Usp8 [Trichonephila clavipes]
MNCSDYGASEQDVKTSTGGEVAEEFAVVIRALWMGQYKSFSPKDFKNTVSRCLAVCIGNEQQDSHEFLVVLMEKLHADLNKLFSDYPTSYENTLLKFGSILTIKEAYLPVRHCESNKFFISIYPQKDKLNIP